MLSCFVVTFTDMLAYSEMQIRTFDNKYYSIL